MDNQEQHPLLHAIFYIWEHLLSFIAILIPLCIVFFIGYLAPLQASFESTDFIKEKSANYNSCTKEFRKGSEILEDIEPGDLIEFKRYLGVFDHWGIYVGNGFVVHLTLNSNDGVEIKKEKLIKIAGEKGVCRPNNLEAFAERLGLEPKRNKNDVVEEAIFMLEEFETGKFIPNYDLLEFNCEHFVTLCAYGVKFSTQANNAKEKEHINYLGKQLTGIIRSKVEQEQLTE